MKLKPIAEQTVVITGASSGIGLTTARMAAKKGANLVLVARNEDALERLTDEINRDGGRAIYIVADVADESALRAAAEAAKEKFGGFDTWVNNAGGSIYGRVVETPTEDLRRLFETNFWGIVNGSKIAVEHLRDGGGALINLGSEVSDAPVPLQTVYSASKHAVKGFTDGLRMELEGDKVPISVTLIKPTAIHTPFPENAKNYLPYEPQLPPPVYAPELVAEAILYCAENPKRDFFIGGMAKAHSSMALNAPRLYDKANELILNSAQNSGAESPENRSDGLYQTNSKLHERGAQERFVREHSIYQESKLHPLVFGALAIGGTLALAALIAKKASAGDRRPSEISGAKQPTFKSKEKTMIGKTENFQAKLKEHMEVVGSDGAHVGTIDHINGDRIKLTKLDVNAAKMHHEIPVAWVASVENDDTARLDKPAREVLEKWTIDPQDEAEFKDSLQKSATAKGKAK